MSLLAPIYNDIRALVARLTAARAAFLDANISSRADGSIWTATRAGYLDGVNARFAAQDDLNNRRGYLDQYVSTRAAQSTADSILTKVNSGLSSVKAVYRGVSVVNAQTINVSIGATVNTSKSSLHLVGIKTGTDTLGISLILGTILNPTTIEFSRNVNTTYGVYVSWEVIEYV